MNAFTVAADNVNDGFHQGVRLLRAFGEREKTRNGEVLALPAPIAVTFRNPKQRVLFAPERDANPFFHFMEGLWMLNGQRDVATVARYNKRISSYSDNGKYFHAAYGYRWRAHFSLDDGEPLDQIAAVIQLLKSEPTTRRAVLAMWDPMADLGEQGKDFPCNTHVYFRARGGCLDMTVCNRSNDIIWGLFGANVVHMSMLHEVVASCAGFSTGEYHQFTNNFHAYTEVFEPLWARLPALHKVSDPYGSPLRAFNMVFDPRTWFTDLKAFMKAPEQMQIYSNAFFADVAEPIAAAHALYRDKRLVEAVHHLQVRCRAEDWKQACVEWIQRRAPK